MGKKLAVAAISLASFIFAASSAFAQGEYGDMLWELESQEGIGFGKALPDLRSVPLVFFGERHTVPEHHALQLRLLRALSDRGDRIVVGLEMFRSGHQEALDKWVRGELTEERFIPIFKTNWGDTWPLYRDIFLFARDRRVPLLALNVPAEITEQVKAKGFHSLAPEQMAELPGVSCDYNDEYMRYIGAAFGVHGTAAKGERFTRFCEAQMVWDSTMAYRLAAYVNAHPGTQVVVLAGISHAWKHGIPAQVKRRATNLAWRVVLPEVTGAQVPEFIGPEHADYLWLLKK